MIIAGSHDTRLVVLSIIIACVASYTALDLAGRVRAAGAGPGRHAWLAAAALAMGGGIWSMHFVAMLAFSMPVPASYDPALTVLSLLLAVIVTGGGFLVVNRSGAGPASLGLSGVFMGLGIVGMHYTGMAAMRMPAELSYRDGLVALSVLIAVGAATAALWLSLRATAIAQKFLAAVAMGLAIAGMHYTAMRAASFTAHAPLAEAHRHAWLDQTNLALALAATTFLILFLALVAAMFDRRFALLAEREAQALRESEERFRTLYRKTPLPLHSLDAEGRVEQVSDAWLSLLGYSGEEVIGRPLVDFMTEASARQRITVDWPKLLAGEKLRDAEYRLVTKDGQVLDCILSAFVERGEAGNFVRALCGLVDVTAYRRAEQALRQSQKVEAVGQLTGGIAHDFNNLLAVVLGNLEVLRKRIPDDPRLVRLVDNTTQAAQRGAALTQRMLAFARRQDLQPQAVDVPDLVRGMADLLQRSIGPLVHVDTRFPMRLSPARVDPHQLELALVNLAVNARDAMAEGGTISIAAREEVVRPQEADGLAPGRYVNVSVADTGCGMDEQVLARALEPFFTTKGVGKGTGLGLPMVQGLAAQSGGRLVLKSEPCRGTTVEIWLPAAAAQEASGPGTAKDARRVSGPAGNPLAILVVDDDPLVLTATVSMLEDMGHSVVEAVSGRQALDLLKQGERVDLVVTDQAMPGMTGLQLAGAIRSAWPAIPVVLATGYAELPEGAGHDLCRLKKPFDQEALARVIRASRTPGAGLRNVVPFRAMQG